MIWITMSVLFLMIVWTYWTTKKIWKELRTLSYLFQIHYHSQPLPQITPIMGDVNSEKN